MNENQVLRMLSAVPEGRIIRLDGHDLRDPMIREVACIAVRNGWLELGELIEGDQYGWFEGEITPAGRAAISALDGENPEP